MFGGSMAGGIHKCPVLLIRDRRLGDPVFVHLNALLVEAVQKLPRRDAHHLDPDLLPDRLFGRFRLSVPPYTFTF